MQAVYIKKSRSDRKTWIDKFIALEPTGGVREIVERIHNGNSSNHVQSGAKDWGPLMAESVAYTDVAAA